MDDPENRTDMTESRLTFRDGCVHTLIDTRCYRVSAVQKTGYKLAGKCTVILGILDAESLPITFTFPRGTADRDALEAVRLFFQELLDQELREKLSDETGPVRALLLAHAFSKTDLIRRG
jgi:His-Xaa-Ser system protein HxsD